METYFCFSLRPVQSFIKQARRTRDFWAGSQLISWLCATAVVAARAQYGRIEFVAPTYSLDFVDELAQGGKPTYPVSNRFTAMVPPGFDGYQVEEAVRTAWATLSDAVWEKAIGINAKTTAKLSLAKQCR